MRFALEVGPARQRLLRPHERAAAVDEDRHAEVDPFHPGQRHRRRPAFGIDLAVHDVGDARFAVDRAPLDLQVGQIERLRDCRHHLLAQLDRVPADPAVALPDRKRWRRLPITERDLAGRLDAIERGRRRECARGHGQQQRHQQAAEGLFDHDQTNVEIGPRIAAEFSTQHCTIPLGRVFRTPLRRDADGVEFRPRERPVTLLAYPGPVPPISTASGATRPRSYRETRSTRIHRCRLARHRQCGRAGAGQYAGQDQGRQGDQRRLFGRLAAVLVRRPGQRAGRLLDRPVQARDRPDRPRRSASRRSR